jgi:hypothetical protein
MPVGLPSRSSPPPMRADTMTQQRGEPLLNFIKGEVRFKLRLASTASHALASKTPGHSQCELILDELDFVPQSLPDLLLDLRPVRFPPSPIPSKTRRISISSRHLLILSTARGRRRAAVRFRRRRMGSGGWWALGWVVEREHDRVRHGPNLFNRIN